ncbi:MAG: hypothetical protein R3E36_06330 [Nitrosomonas sp.]|nr:hypothetical protein [Nitrosomonas sp.]MDR4651976.1 hypothetical protein [Nitrosomonas sp.]
MKKTIYRGFFVLLFVFALPFMAKATTLGLTTQGPSLDSSFAFVDYFEFGADGDLSSFGGIIDSSNGISPSGFTEFSFGVGFSLSDPTNTATGGFDVFDENGLFLSGDLAAVGFTENVIEFLFDHLTSAAASDFGSSVLMMISFADQLGANPFSGLIDGTFYDTSVNIARVVPEPQTLVLCALALALMSFVRRR